MGSSNPSAADAFGQFENRQLAGLPKLTGRRHRTTQAHEAVDHNPIHNRSCALVPSPKIVSGWPCRAWSGTRDYAAVLQGHCAAVGVKMRAMLVRTRECGDRPWSWLRVALTFVVAGAQADGFTLPQ